MGELNSSVVSVATTDRTTLFQWGIVLGEREYFRTSLYKSRACNTVSCVMAGRSYTLRQAQLLVFINRHSRTMNLVKKKSRED